MTETVYVVKYALTKGILPFEADKFDEKSMIRGRFTNSKYDEWFFKGQWAKTLPEAIELAEAMRLRKIASLKKQIARLEKLSFEKGNE